MLEEEKNFLERIISFQNKKKEGSSGMRQKDVGSDLDKLKEICSHQKQQIEVSFNVKLIFYPKEEIFSDSAVHRNI